MLVEVTRFDCFSSNTLSGVISIPIVFQVEMKLKWWQTLSFKFGFGTSMFFLCLIIKICICKCIPAALNWCFELYWDLVNANTSLSESDFMNPPQKLETLEKGHSTIFQCHFLFTSDQNYLQTWIIPLSIKTSHAFHRHQLIVSGQLIFVTITFHIYTRYLQAINL